jgi:hypothetical protein
MMGRSSLVLLAALAIVLPHGGAGARTRFPFNASMLTPVVESGPTLAPFQHIRFCLQYQTIADQIPRKVNALT